MNRHAFRIRWDDSQPGDAEVLLRRFLEALPAALAGLGARVALAGAPVRGRTALCLAVKTRCDWVRPTLILSTLAGRHGLRAHRLPRAAYSPR